MFFFLAQTEQGDIFKVTLEADEGMVSFSQALLSTYKAASKQTLSSLN